MKHICFQMILETVRIGGFPDGLGRPFHSLGPAMLNDYLQMSSSW